MLFVGTPLELDENISTELVPSLDDVLPWQERGVQFLNVTGAELSALRHEVEQPFQYVLVCLNDSRD